MSSSSSVTHLRRTIILKFHNKNNNKINPTSYSSYTLLFHKWLSIHSTRSIHANRDTLRPGRKYYINFFIHSFQPGRIWVLLQVPCTVEMVVRPICIRDALTNYLHIFFLMFIFLETRSLIDSSLFSPLLLPLSTSLTAITPISPFSPLRAISLNNTSYNCLYDNYGCAHVVSIMKLTCGQGDWSCAGPIQDPWGRPS